MTKQKKLGILLMNISIALILIGFFLMIQPFLMVGYTYGFSVILAGVILFNVASHL